MAPLRLRSGVGAQVTSQRGREELDLNNSPLNVHFYALYFDGVTS